MRNFLQDLWFAARILRNNPGFTSVAILTLGLGIAANTTVFGWIDAILLRPIPGVRSAGELTSLEAVDREGTRLPLTHPDFRDFQRELTSASGVLAAHLAFCTVGPADSPRRVLGQVVSANYFAVLGVKPYLGRVFLAEEDRDERGAFPYAVISHRLWRSYFNADPGVPGRRTRINGHDLTILGVAPPGFAGTFGGVSFDVWVPLSMVLEMGALNTWAASDRNARFLEVTVRLKPGVTAAQARAEVEAIAARISRTYPDTHRGVGATLVPVWQASYGLQKTLRDPLRVLMGACVLVLLIACANVANLLMARTVTRQREFGIRLALGAGRWRLLRQLLTEMLVVTGAAAIVAMLFSQWLGESLYYVLPTFDSAIRSAVEPLLQIKPGANLIAFAILISVAAVCLSTLVPALAMSRLEVNESLKQGGRSSSSGVRSHRARSLLVVSEVALATVALVGAGVALRSFQKLVTVHPGFDPQNVLITQFYLSSNGYSLVQEKQFGRNLRARLTGAPGIDQVSEADFAPLSALGPATERVHGDVHSTNQTGVDIVSRASVAPGYFDLMRIPLLGGRDFTDRDGLDSPRVIIVNQTFARRYFGYRDPLGRTVRVSGKPATVIGLVKDSKYRTHAESPAPFFYGCFEQRFFSGHNHVVYLRAKGDPQIARNTLRREVGALDPNAAIYETLSLSQHTEAGLFGERIAASLLTALGALSLALAAVGLYSVMAYAVGERTHEIGIRMAMGAHRAQVLGLILRQGLLMTAGGLAAGFGASIAGMRVLSTLFDLPVSLAEPVVFAAASGCLILIAVLASYLPAYRASRVQPLTALRSE